MESVLISGVATFPFFHFHFHSCSTYHTANCENEQRQEVFQTFQENFSVKLAFPFVRIHHRPYPTLYHNYIYIN